VGRDRVTVRTIARKKGKEKIVALTAYDHPTAKLVDRAGVDLILIGDSLGNVVLGHENTLPVTMEEMLHHAKAVARARPRALVVADMPFLSFQTGVEEAVRNAGRFIKEAGVDGVKIERGLFDAEVRAMVRASIPVIGHVGLTPQSVLPMGGFRVQGRDGEGARILAEARTLEAAGCFAIVLEGIPRDLAQEITDALSIPTIGIGAGAGCDGQIQVFHDLLGLDPEFLPKHARRYADLAEIIVEGVGRYAADVRAGTFPSEEESFGD
jgi:3-methyl-2-oxobutanoate hydroxymethyltransferase